VALLAVRKNNTSSIISSPPLLFCYQHALGVYIYYVSSFVYRPNVFFIDNHSAAGTCVRSVQVSLNDIKSIKFSIISQALKNSNLAYSDNKYYKHFVARQNKYFMPINLICQCNVDRFQDYVYYIFFSIDLCRFSLHF